MPIVEFTTFQATDALIADPTLKNPTLDTISKAEGFVRGYTGRQLLEDRQTVHFAIEWESLDAHTKFQNSAKWTEASALLKPGLGSTPTTHHIAFEGDYTIPFESPVTEIAVIKLRDDKSTEDLTKAVANNSPGVVTRGEVVERPRSFYLVFGWDTSEEHKTILQTDQAKPFVAKIADVVTPDSSITHVLFTKV